MATRATKCAAKVVKEDETIRVFGNKGCKERGMCTKVVKDDEIRMAFGNKGCKERVSQRRWSKKTSLEGYLATRVAKVMTRYIPPFG